MTDDTKPAKEPDMSRHEDRPFDANYLRVGAAEPGSYVFNHKVSAGGTDLIFSAGDCAIVTFHPNGDVVFGSLYTDKMDEAAKDFVAYVARYWEEYTQRSHRVASSPMWQEAKALYDKSVLIPALLNRAKGGPGSEDAVAEWADLPSHSKHAWADVVEATKELEDGRDQ